MPNWCDNDLRITGPAKDLLDFAIVARGRYVKDLEEGEILDFNSFIPYPDEYRILDEEARRGERSRDGYNSGGYEWCCNNWGTKWNSTNPVVYKYKRSLFYNFETAWSPPLPVVHVMSLRFPRLRFSIKFYELGVGFQGHYIFKNGEVLKEENKSYSGGRGG